VQELPSVGSLHCAFPSNLAPISLFPPPALFPAHLLMASQREQSVQKRGRRRLRRLGEGIWTPSSETKGEPDALPSSTARTPKRRLGDAFKTMHKLNMLLLLASNFFWLFSQCCTSKNIDANVFPSIEEHPDFYGTHGVNLWKETNLCKMIVWKAKTFMKLME
jgi:hypothetical protein